MVKAKELLDKSVEDLNFMYEDVCKEIYKIIDDVKANKKIESLSQLRMKKKDRARILTMLRQKNGDSGEKK